MHCVVVIFVLELETFQRREFVLYGYIRHTECECKMKEAPKMLNRTNYHALSMFHCEYCKKKISLILKFWVYALDYSHEMLNDFHVFLWPFWISWFHSRILRVLSCFPLYCCGLFFLCDCNVVDYALCLFLCSKICFDQRILSSFYSLI
jgi:hypothetical protein